jgi:small subunit ribosomal protein S8
MKMQKTASDAGLLFRIRHSSFCIRTTSESDAAMNNQDPIADMLTRIRNANRVGRRMVLIPRSKICLGIAQVLKEEGYIEEFDSIDDSTQGQIRVKLKYSSAGQKVIHTIDRQSKPGCRVYRGVDDLPRILNGMGIAVVSTSKGVMSDRRARENNVGGELLCTVS